MNGWKLEAVERLKGLRGRCKMSWTSTGNNHNDFFKS